MPFTARLCKVQIVSFRLHSPPFSFSLLKKYHTIYFHAYFHEYYTSIYLDRQVWIMQTVSGDDPLCHHRRNSFQKEINQIDAIAAEYMSHFEARIILDQIVKFWYYRFSCRIFRRYNVHLTLLLWIGVTHMCICKITSDLVFSWKMIYV